MNVVLTSIVVHVCVFVCVTSVEQAGVVHRGVLGCDVTNQVAHRGQHGRQSEPILLTCREAQREDRATEAVTNKHI